MLKVGMTLACLVAFIACSDVSPGTPTETTTSTATRESATPTATSVPPATAATPTQVKELITFDVEPVFRWLDLQSPTFMTEIPDGTGRAVALEQSGRVLAFPNTPESQSGETSEFLNLTDRVNRGGNEEGLLGLAFHPHYEGNGRLFVYYSASDPRRSVLSELSAEPGGTADHSSERVVMEIEQPYSNHNGGMLAFGPDGHLYVGLGDGGAGGDPQGNGQDPMTLLGSILRIVVDGARPYEIPADNPFVGGNGGAPEVWAYGLRNPWRFAFEPNSSALWVADVGQNRYEEVSRVQAGRNYGWNVMEGPSCYGAASCDRDGLELPVAWYDHGDGCSVTGGYVNRDPLTPALNGSFIFADYCSGTVWRVNEQMDDGLEELVDTDLNISSFGEMSDGSLYIVAAGRGAGIYRLAKRD